jgi:hypothetical protein
MFGTRKPSTTSQPLQLLRAAKLIYRSERLLKSCTYFSGLSWPQLSTNRT